MIDEPLSIAEKFRMLQLLGFDGVELNSPSELDEKEVVEAKRRQDYLFTASSIQSIGNKPSPIQTRLFATREEPAWSMRLNRQKYLALYCSAGTSRGKQRSLL